MSERRVLTENDLRLIRQRAVFDRGISQDALEDLIYTIRELRKSNEGDA